ncbi:carboxylesterase/lipase family protein [Noviherbaspirillum galbum]|uniref:Carboxylic ester hydrolase n=1 Tax=Noviherbaspirillum galbum TaxID=2709383 RepID=A0A6B3SX72_9BURK|nr:carboxylesterase family protein [Noviherbaspirillum galbum]NEX63686.1 carboxylesterase family protein [Noviherbaspirillum galbum]
MQFTKTAVAIALAASLGVMAGCGGGGNDAPEFRTTSYGTVQGVNDSAKSGTYFWKGIPFAKAPTGNLRWKAPVEPDTWPQALATQKFGNACIQNGRIYGPGSNNTYDATIGTTLNTPVGSEDCLTLNIWRPASEAKNLPVILFLYGGSNISGYTADPVYDGANLARSANAIVVTANYRVGVFGFFNMAQLKTGANAAEDSGNFALLDNIQALKFIQNNIDNFGGDKGNVTLMGQSAGAINVWSLIASPLTAGLFHRAAPLSGGISLATNLPQGTLPILSPAATYATQSSSLLANLVIADGKATDTSSAQAYIATLSNQQVADYMRSKDAKGILTTVLTKGLNSSGPIPDNAVLPKDPIAAISAGAYRKVPMLVGSTSEEGKLFQALFPLLPGHKPGFLISDATRFATMMNYNPDAAPAVSLSDLIDASYLPPETAGTGYNATAAFFTNNFFFANRDNALNAVKSQQPNVWAYQFNWAQEPAPWNVVYGAAHAFDLPFIFRNFGPSLFSNVVNSKANEAGRLELSDAMMNSIGAFAKNGDPNNASLGVSWQPWPQKLIFDATQTKKQISAQ